MIDICFWCNRPKNDGDEGKSEFFDYDPCDNCNEVWDKGVLVIQVVDKYNNNPPIIEGLFPTGIWAVVKMDDVKKVLTDYPGIDKIVESKTMYVNVDDWDKVIKYRGLV